MRQDSRRRMQVIEVANRIRRKGSYHGKSIHSLAVRRSSHIACPPLVLRRPSIGHLKEMQTTKDDLNSSSLISLGAGRKCKACLLRIGHEENATYLTKGTVR